MNAALLLLASTACGIDVGWQPLPNGGFEYIIQIGPETLATLQPGDKIESEIPAFLRGVRTYRIVIGNDLLPQEGVPPSLEPAETEPAEEPEAEPPGDPEADEPESGTTGEEAIAGAEEGGAEEADEHGHTTRHSSGLGERDRLQPPEELDAADEPAPGHFDADENSEPLVERTGYDENAAGPGAVDEASPSDEPAADAVEPAKPWVPFSLAMLGLFASVGGNCYLGWLALGLRGRYLAALSALRERRIEVDAD